mmetsp:Transcript_620/g.2441  ORF Transcript_620/g.2441 Transcript_620/m.2441 type:complete len:407 (-) Transcript_620:186-1406(-)
MARDPERRLERLPRVLGRALQGSDLEQRLVVDAVQERVDRGKPLLLPAQVRLRRLERLAGLGDVDAKRGIILVFSFLGCLGLVGLRLGIGGWVLTIGKLGLGIIGRRESLGDCRLLFGREGQFCRTHLCGGVERDGGVVRNFAEEVLVLRGDGPAAATRGTLDGVHAEHTCDLSGGEFDRHGEVRAEPGEALEEGHGFALRTLFFIWGWRRFLAIGHGNGPLGADVGQAVVDVHPRRLRGVVDEFERNSFAALELLAHNPLAILAPDARRCRDVAKVHLGVVKHHRFLLPVALVLLVVLRHGLGFRLGFVLLLFLAVGPGGHLVLLGLLKVGDVRSRAIGVGRKPQRVVCHVLVQDVGVAGECAQVFHRVLDARFLVLDSLNRILLLLLDRSLLLGGELLRRLVLL